MSDTAKAWKERMARKAAERAAQIQSVPVNFAGFAGRAHRLSLISWAKAGKLPQYLTTAMFAAAKGRASETRKSDLAPEEYKEYLRFQCAAFCEMMDEPRFVEKPEAECAEDEIAYAEFVLEFPEVVNEAVQWQLSGCPEITIQTDGGEVSIEDLYSFRDSGAGSVSGESRFRVQGVWWDTEPTPRHP